MGACNQRQSQISGTTLHSCPDDRSTLFDANICNQCHGNEAILLSRTGDRSLYCSEQSTIA